MEIIGWIGAVLLAFCGVPQAIKTFYTKRATDFSWFFLFMWYFGEILVVVYVINDNYINNNWQLPLIFNYVLNILIITYLLYAKGKCINETP